MCMVCFAGSGTHSWSPVSMFSSLPSLFHSMLTLSFTLFSVLATESYWSWPKLEVYIKDIFLSPSLLCAVDLICSSCYSSPLTIFATFFFAYCLTNNWNLWQDLFLFAIQPFHIDGKILILPRKLITMTLIWFKFFYQCIC